MSRSGYTDDYDNDWSHIMWRGAVASAFRGRRGQAFLRELLAALDALPSKRLVENELECGGEVCTLGAVGRARGIDMNRLDPEDAYGIAGKLDIARAMACEIMYENDKGGASYWNGESPERRFERMREWVVSEIRG